GRPPAPFGPADSHRPWVSGPLRRSDARSARRRFAPLGPRSRVFRVASPLFRPASESTTAAPVGDATSLSATPLPRRPATAPTRLLRCRRTSPHPPPAPHLSVY